MRTAQSKLWVNRPVRFPLSYGTFLLDHVILRRPMEKALSELNLEDDISKRAAGTIARRSSDPPFVRSLVAHELADWWLYSSDGLKRKCRSEENNPMPSAGTTVGGRGFSDLRLWGDQSARPKPLRSSKAFGSGSLPDEGTVQQSGARYRRAPGFFRGSRGRTARPDTSSLRKRVKASASRTSAHL